MSHPATETVRRSAVPATALQRLTVDAAKDAAYRHDTYFREGLWSFERHARPERHHDVTFVVLKPDAIAGRRGEQVLGILRERGWAAVAATTVRFDPLLTREIWRYQFNAASAQRIAVVDHLLGSGPSLLVLLYDTSSADLPASVRLTAAKGSAEPRAAREGDLRTRIGRVNGLFNFMHTADEPADVVRELQLFSYQAGWDWCRDALRDPAAVLASANPAASMRALLNQVTTEIPAHDLDLPAALRRLAAGQDRWSELALDHARVDEVDLWLAELRRTPLPSGTGRWDVLTVLTGWIECNEPDVAALLDTPLPARWAAITGHRPVDMPRSARCPS
ncbi:nucleoside diphosphate kinase [Actinoplanes sp. SE50]|uniref:nucleoside-diphosphate kinase n=1 Tax=unclassified Actinoplanes TaxID=2626549 RepID=UPI00023ECA1F|nr:MULTISPECIES: nucleoside-diphosphate kinase [unclassified Actinoplanes]AEV87110.1 Nucleoside diphosphate kinase [Actinoplanes sp. SE50/110]ATO85508.1 nucleoside diphosphate kinase [Actinoplanes sp. SE50]SLM02920.1 nucleoside-diphosphate kinase [Actinoplanes sp. SE50/110]